MLSACKADEPIGNIDKLPTDVFFLNDTKWKETQSQINGWNIDKSYLDTVIYSVKQIEENKAELNRLIIKVTGKYTDYSRQIFVPDSSWTIGPELYGYILLEGKKVYYQYNATADKELMYDFSLNVGDVFDREYFYDDAKFYVESIDNVLLGNEYRRKYNFILKPTMKKYDFSAIEGIGCVGNEQFFDKHFFYTRNIFLNEIGDPQITRVLQAVYYKDKIIWKHPRYKGE